MNKKSCSMALIMLIFYFIPSYLAANNLSTVDTTAVDSIKKLMPDFTNVTVLVETAWGTSDKSVNVDVYVVKEGKNPSEIILKKGQHQECSIEIINGLVVKIIDSKTGKILKKYGKME